MFLVAPPQGGRNVTMEAPPVALFDSLKVRIASRFCNSHRHLGCGISSIILRAVQGLNSCLFVSAAMW